MGYLLNRLDEPVFMAVPKPMLTEFGIHYRLESCESDLTDLLFQEQAALMQRHGHSMAISGLQPASISNSQPVKSPSLSGGGREVSAVGNSSSGQSHIRC